MSQIGYTPENIGERFNIVTTHYTAYDLLKDWNGSLAYNSLILCSPLTPQGNELVDYGSYALIATDYQGNGVRLTYHLRPGNGLKVNAHTTYSWDDLSLEIDKDSIMTNDYEELHVVKVNIIDNDTLMANGSEPIGNGRYRTRIGVVTANLDKASDISYGIAKGDGLTIDTENGILSVQTQNLEYVDDETNTSGIVRFNPDVTEGYDWRTVEANNGVLHVVTYNLDRATADQVGVMKPDTDTTYVHAGGILSVRTAGLEKASYIDGELSYGIVRGDNYTIQIDPNEPGVLRANSRNMAGASTEEYGVVKLDSYSLNVDQAGFTKVNRFPEIIAILNRYMDDYNYIISRLIDHENRITALENAAAAEYIYSFNNYGTSTTVLVEPYWDLDSQTVISESELKTVVFSINTNCPFNVSFEFEDQSNVTPQITLQTVRLGNGPAIEASALQNYAFSSTEMNESTLSFTFNCRNYASSTEEAFTLTNVTIRVSSINNSAVNASGHHIFKRWNMNKYIQAPEITPEIVPVTTTYVYHEYTGPYLQYYNGTLQNAINNYVIYSSPNQDNTNVNTYSNIISSERTNITNARHEDRYLEGNNARLISYVVGFDNEYGSYALINAYQGARTSYSFMFSTIYIDTEIKQVNTSYHAMLNGIDVSYEYAYMLNELTTEPEVGYSYSILYGSSPLMIEPSNVIDSANKVESSIYVSDVSVKYRDKLGNDVEDEENPWNPTEDNVTWFSYNISTLASNTGYYNILTLSSSFPLTNQDRLATITLKGRTIPIGHENNILDDNGFSEELKFSLIEDIELSQPRVWMNCQCSSNSEAVIKFTITRSNDSIVIGDYWGVDLKYIFIKSTGETSYKDNEEPFNIVITNIPKESFEYVINISINDTEYLPDILINYLDEGSSNHNEYNNISTIKISDCTISGLSNDENLEILPVPINGFYPCVYGSWPINLQQPPQTMSFGGARITNVSIAPWGDDQMTLSFAIRPAADGSTTLPVGTYIKPNVSADLLFYNGNLVSSYSNYYERCYIEDDPTTNKQVIWSANGCNVKMILDQYPDDPSNVDVQLFSYQYMSTQTISVSSSSPMNPANSASNEQGTVGGRGNTTTEGNESEAGSSESGVIDKTNVNAGSTAQHNASLGIQQPVLTSFTGIRFKFGLTAYEKGVTNPKTCELNFLTCLGNYTDKVNFTSAMYNVGANTQLDTPIVNALYNTNPGVSNSSTASSENEEGKTTLDDIYDLINKLENQVNTMQNQVNNNM